MTKSTYPLRLPSSIKAAAARLAKEDGVSPNQWIASAVAHKVGVIETAAEFLKRKTGTASEEDFARTLARVSDVAPLADDDLPAHLR